MRPSTGSIKTRMSFGVITFQNVLRILKAHHLKMDVASVWNLIVIAYLHSTAASCPLVATGGINPFLETSGSRILSRAAILLIDPWRDDSNTENTNHRITSFRNNMASKSHFSIVGCVLYSRAL